MSSYTARAEWDATGWWVVTIPEVPEAITQVRRLDQVPKDVGEVLKLVGKGAPTSTSCASKPIIPAGTERWLSGPLAYAARLRISTKQQGMPCEQPWPPSVPTA